jgi:hypothetical protein
MARRVNPLTRRFVGLAFAVLIGLTISPLLAPMAAIAVCGFGQARWDGASRLLFSSERARARVNDGREARKGR